MRRGGNEKGRERCSEQGRDKGRERRGKRRGRERGRDALSSPRPSPISSGLRLAVFSLRFLRLRVGRFRHSRGRCGGRDSGRNSGKGRDSRGSCCCCCFRGGGGGGCSSGSGGSGSCEVIPQDRHVTLILLLPFLHLSTQGSQLTLIPLHLRVGVGQVG